MVLHCPNCDSTLFKVKDGLDGSQILYCFHPNQCDWSFTINPPAPLLPSKKKRKIRASASRDSGVLPKA
jgi:hypothetical protein